MGPRLQRAVKALRFPLAVTLAVSNAIWFELCSAYGVKNYFALSMFILGLVYAIHYANPKR